MYHHIAVVEVGDTNNEMSTIKLSGLSKKLEVT